MHIILIADRLYFLDACADEVHDVVPAYLALVTLTKESERKSTSMISNFRTKKKLDFL